MTANNFIESSVHKQTEMNHVIDENVFDARDCTIQSCYGNTVKTSSERWDLDNVEMGSRSDRPMKQLEKMIKLLQRSMAVFGLYDIHHEEMEIEHRAPVGKVKKLLCGTKQSLYRIIILMFMVLFTVRGVLSFFIEKNIPKFMIMRICIFIWSLQVTFSTALLMKASHEKFGSQRKACDWCFLHVMPLFKELEVNRSTKSVRRQLVFSIIIGWVLVIFNITSVTFFLLYEGTSFHEILIAATIKPLPSNMITKSIVIGWNVFASVAWVFPMLYVISLNIVLKYSFKLSREALYNAISKKQNKKEYLQCLYKQRILHLNISKTADLLDKDFSYFFANWFSTNVPTACLLLYQMTRPEETDTFTLITYIFWFGANILPISVTAAFAAVTHDAAHSILEHIHDIGTMGISLEQLGQLTLFLSKLNGRPVGFTVLNLITLTKEVLLTIGGLYLTYFFVLWQFI